jgi:hypothetical protein
MKSATLAIALLTCLWFSGSVFAADTPTPATSTETASAPPARPLPITPEQAAALEVMAEQPEYAINPDTRAAFSPEADLKVSEISAVGTYVAYFGGLTWLLIAAAPL